MRVIEEYRASQGHDISAKALRDAGFSDEHLQQAIHSGLIKKHQVTAPSGATENRFKVAKNWKSLNT